MKLQVFMIKKCSNYSCLAVVNVESVIKKDENYT